MLWLPAVQFHTNSSKANDPGRYAKIIDQVEKCCDVPWEDFNLKRRTYIDKVVIATPSTIADGAIKAFQSWEERNKTPVDLSRLRSSSGYDGKVETEILAAKLKLLMVVQGDRGAMKYIVTYDIQCGLIVSIGTQLEIDRFTFLADSEGQLANRIQTEVEAGTKEEAYRKGLVGSISSCQS